MGRMSLTKNRLDALLKYYPRTGIFRWRVRRGSASRGRIAGCDHYKDGRVIVVDGRLYGAHQLAFLTMTGKIPTSIDHRDRIKQNNAWRNLRDATHSEQMRNRGALRTNKTGLRGVYPHQGKFGARIQRDKRRVFLGYYTTSKQAHAAYLRFAKTHDGQFFTKL